MIRFPAALTAETFLGDYWQKQPLFMPSAVDGPRPALTRNELGWLATLDDVESRIVFTDRSGAAPHYRSETGPFEEDYLRELPRRDWTLLVHDVEKHLPELRTLFSCVPFIPDWRIDDLMVSFAAPGGGVGPHEDNYDVFLLQGTGVRDWHITTDAVAADRTASEDLALLREFEGARHVCKRGDVLYLPPGVPHWGTAQRACLTYSIGMRAPQLSDLNDELPDDESSNPFYRDPDLALDEVAPGFISRRSQARAEALSAGQIEPAALGRFVTLTKDWLKPEGASPQECNDVMERLADGHEIEVHGMARIAWDDSHVYANGSDLPLTPGSCNFVESLCAERILRGPLNETSDETAVVRWLLQQGVFELPAIS